MKRREFQKSVDWIEGPPYNLRNIGVYIPLRVVDLLNPNWLDKDERKVIYDVWLANFCKEVVNLVEGYLPGDPGYRIVDEDKLYL